MTRRLAENVARGRRAIALARQRGMDTTAWEEVIADLEQQHLLDQSSKLAREVSEWADNDSRRWQCLHSALLRMYTPAWERVDARDILVAWAAACLALTRAKRELMRLENRGATLRDLDAKMSRQADLSFWGRLADRLAAQAPTALAEDAKAAKVLAALVNSKHGDGK